MNTTVELKTIIAEIEMYARKEKINHRFVGGVSFGGLLNEHTSWKILIPEKKIILHKFIPLTLVRNDKTTRDVDIILFCEDIKKIQALKLFILQLQGNYRKRHLLFPEFTVEGAIYPSFGKRNWLTQYVTGLEVETFHKKDHIYLVFDAIKQEISWESVEPWTVSIGDTSYTVRNPIGDYYAYLFRSPSGPKPKDKLKINFLKKLADDVILNGKSQKPKVDYMSDTYYGNWKKYIDLLATTTDPDIIIKKMIAQMYWNTLGTNLSHQGGLFSFLAGQFTGVRQ